MNYKIRCEKQLCGSYEKHEINHIFGESMDWCAQDDGESGPDYELLEDDLRDKCLEEGRFIHWYLGEKGVGTGMHHVERGVQFGRFDWGRWKI
jgi:hypothetical protein